LHSNWNSNCNWDKGTCYVQQHDSVVRLTNRLHSSHDSSWNGFPDWQKPVTSVSKVGEALLICRGCRLPQNMGV